MAPARVVIAGGGFAAVEAALAVRALADDRVELTLVAPSARFDYRPAATADAFAPGVSTTYDLREVARDVGATFRKSALEAVAPQPRRLRLSSGAWLSYDALIVAIGARARAAVPGALTFRDHRDSARFAALFNQVEVGEATRLVFTVPSSHCWSLPAYELALLTSAHAARTGAELETMVVTPEREPLELLGTAASRRVMALLADQGVRFLGSSIPHSVRGDGRLALQFDGAVRADHVVAVPELHGRRLPGIPSSWLGFIPVDRLGRVQGVAHVYAAGDITTFPVKQGGLATQQADRIAHTIAGELGAPVSELHERFVIRARLLHGDGALVLRTELDDLGRPTPAAIQHPESRIAPDLKVFGRYLTPYLSMYESRRRGAA
jgi:sulfide:quinone oxidoreductase